MIFYHRVLERSLEITFIFLLILATKWDNTSRFVNASTSFVDSSTLKPSVLLISPQSFRVPINSIVNNQDNDHLSHQYVAVINNIQNNRDNQILREQYKKLTLQVRDAETPISGQLFFEHTFDYFPPNKYHLLIPLNLEQVSPIKVRDVPSGRNYANAVTGITEQTTTANRPQRLIVSIRPHKLESGFGSENIEITSSFPIPVETIGSQDGRRSFGFIQTDKPIYKPEDKVRIRALVMNENLRPIIGDELRIQIKNPQKLVVEEIRFPRSPTATGEGSLTTYKYHENSLFLDHIFEFPPEPMLGSWSVHLLHNDPIANDTAGFEVKEYVLPPFEIEFNSPKYILPTTQIISGSVYAKYHYGKPVQGKAQFKFGYRESQTSRPKFIARSSIKNIDPITGRVDYRINSDKFKETDWFPRIAGCKLVIEIVVTEMTTGHREAAQDESCVFLSSGYRISFEDSNEDFKAGLTQQLTVQVLEMQTGRPLGAGFKVIAQYRDQNRTLLSSSPHFNTTESRNPVDFEQRLDLETVTDPMGRATLNIGPIKDEISTIDVSLKVLNGSATGKHLSTDLNIDANSSQEIAHGYHRLVRHISLNGHIALINKTLTQMRVGELFVSDLLIRDAVVVPDKIFFMTVARGQILGLHNLNSEGLVSFTITESMIPAVRIVLFALTQDSVGYLSDSMRINVDQELHCGLKLRYKSNSLSPTKFSPDSSFKPNDVGKLAIQARTGDTVSIMAVDSAVYSLNNRTNFDSSRVIERLKRLDPGCGFGGGKNNLDVFFNAGLMLFKDTPDPTQLYFSGMGSSCESVANQFKLIEDMQLGYSRPQFATWAAMHRPRAVDLGAVFKQKMARLEHLRHLRSKREVDTEAVLKKYRNPLHRSCCRLGTLEDLPQRRNCSIRARIVERYMRQDEDKSCSTIYFECCRSINSERVLLSSVVSDRNLRGSDIEPIMTGRIVPQLHASRYSDSGQLAPNVGQLDNIEAQTLIRRDFRETWLFDLIEINSSDGSGALDIRLPHSITSWSVTAMALNREHPICMMAQPLKLTTFQDIFLQVSMPYKVIQGEQIDIVTTIFNYSPRTQEVFVYMYGVEDICSEAEPGERSDRKRIKLDRHTSQSVLFPMIPLKIGKFPVKILAITTQSNNSDIIERELNVVARGKPVIDETTFSLDPMNHQRRSKRAIQTRNLVDEIDSTKGLQRSRVRLTPTRDSDFIVPQTQECIVSAIGDKMGQSVQTTMMDVENLIRLPHGCGEQVMIYLGPTLYTARYLSHTNKLTGDVRWRAIRYIQSGYKRIINFRKESGAFSAFPQREPSIWLTAFVSKMLCQTEKTSFIAEEIHVDKNVINSALNWLLKEQDKDTGTWVEINPVYHREMLGGVLKENALTAFVTLALNECAHHSPDLMEPSNPSDNKNTTESSSSHDHRDVDSFDKLRLATQKAEQALLLDRYKAVKERNPYVLALTSYALSFSKPHEAASIMNDLILFVEKSQSRNHMSWRGDYPIETASYALMALIELAPILDPLVANSHSGSQSSHMGSSHWVPGPDALALSNWLSSRRSYTGAMESTQDTIVALEALSKLAQVQSAPTGNSWFPAGPKSPILLCNVTINNRTRRSIEFDKNNAQVLQSFKLNSFEIDPLNSEMLDIVTSGNGLGTMSIKVKYNVFHEEDELCRFNIDSTIEEWQPKVNMQSHNINKGDYPEEEAHQDSRSNGTIEDDYFKTFDKSMLNELNLIDLNQHQTIQNSSSLNQPSESYISKRNIIRFRRYANQMMDLSTSKNDSSFQSSFETWTSKVVSSIKAKLPSWLSSKDTSTTSRPQITTTTTIRPATNKGPSSKVEDTNSHQSDRPAQRRSYASRRSTQSLVPMVVQPTGIPMGANLNNLSSQIELHGANETNSALNHSQNILENPSSKLILLLRVCVHHMASKNSEMAVIEVGILSGFKPNQADLREIIQDPGTPAMKYEISADKSLVIFYMHYIPYEGLYCLQFRLVRESLVYNLQSGYIRAYEYYSPTHSCSNFYTPARVSDLIETKCDSTGQICECASKSLCPSTKKLLDLSEIHSVNATSARSHLTDLICSNKFDFVSLVKLKNVRHLEPAKMFKLMVKVKSDLKGNLTKIMEAQKQQKSHLSDGMKKPQLSSTESLITIADDEDETSLDYLSLNLDSSCVKSESLLLHLAHPSQWKQGGELMILFGRYSRLERRFYMIAPKTHTTTSTQFPKPKPTVIGGLNSSPVNDQTTSLVFDDAQQLQYSTTMLLDKDSILHDVSYQSKVGPRDAINNLILWIELRARRERWTCPQVTD